VSPLVAPPWCPLVMPAGSCIASCRPLIAPPSRCLVSPPGCCIASCRLLIVLPSCCLAALAVALPLAILSLRHLSSTRRASLLPHCLSSSLVAPRVILSSSRRAGWLFCHLLMRCPLVSRRLILVAPAGCHAVISCCPLVAPPSCPLIVC
jgi:hypothetical protein